MDDEELTPCGLAPPEDYEPDELTLRILETMEREEPAGVRAAAVTLPPIQYLPTPNQSARPGGRSGIHGLVVHETEGSFEGAVSWLRQARSEVSAHIVLSEDGSRCAQLVPWTRKAWHAMNANGYTIGFELAGKTATANNPAQLARAARIIAFLAQEFGFDPAWRSYNHGWGAVCRHRDLGAFGGGHSDPGGFPFDTFMEQALAEYRRGGFLATWGTY